MCSSEDFHRARRSQLARQKQQRWEPYRRTSSLAILPEDRPELIRAARIFEDTQFENLAFLGNNLVDRNFLPVIQHAETLRMHYVDAVRVRAEALEELEPDMFATLKQRPLSLKTLANPYSRNDLFEPNLLNPEVKIGDLSDPVLRLLQYREEAYEELASGNTKRKFLSRYAKVTLDSEGGST